MKDRILWKGSQQIPTAGRTALSVYPSPSGDVIAVLSADGWKRLYIPSPIPFSKGWGGRGYAGQHYVEFFTLPELERKGPAVRIPLTTAGMMSLSPQWTAGGEYAVYQESSYDVCIIPTFKLEQER